MSSLRVSGMMQRCLLFAFYRLLASSTDFSASDLEVPPPPTPPTFPGGGWRRKPSLLGMPSVVAFAVSSHNLVSRDRKIGVQCSVSIILG